MTMVPTLMSEVFSRRCLRVDVFPEPRKPARRMVGIGFFWGAASGDAADAFRREEDGGDDGRVREDNGELG